jgi:DNA (cytosine-5)-methyltransferase 1
MEGDITKISVEEVLAAAKLEIGECGLISGGFPCQGFSHAGPRMIDDPRNVLYKECVRMVRGIMPRSFLFENVPGLISMDKGRIIDQICTDLAESGYQVNWQRLNAADYGVPQHRIRVFFIGTRNDVMVFQEKGNPQYHMGGTPGPVKHPDFYLEKFKIQNKYAEKYQQTLI